jgi:nitrile hydratase
MVSKFALEGVDELIRTGGSAHAKVEAQPKFKVGDRVRTVNNHPNGHTRVPQYARDKVGKVVQIFGAFMFPDTVAHDQGENPQHLYNLVFEAQELWGPDANPIDTLYISMYEDYLIPDEA